MLRNLCDVHTHTLFSRHAYSTIRENVLAAHEAGLELLGSADHFSAMTFSRTGTGEADLRDYQFFLNLRTWPRVWEGVRLLRGIEVDITSLDGSLFGDGVTVELDIVQDRLRHATTLYDRVVEGCDYAIASVHGRGFARDATLSQVTDMYLSVLARSEVLVLGHTGRAGLPFDVRAVVSEAARRHKLIEINEHSLESRPRSGRTWSACAKIAEVCAEEGCGVVVNTDAHICCSIGRVPTALSMLEELGFPQELVMTRSADAFLGAMARAGLEVPSFPGVVPERPAQA